MIETAELRTLTQISPVRVWLAIAIDWLLVAGVFALAIAFPNPWVWAFCFIFAARQQLAFAILMHDGSHRRMFQSVRANDLICQFLCAAPLFFSMYSYQKLHLKHHRDPLAPDDPDLSLIGGYPISLTSFVRKILRDAFGISYFKFIRYFIYMARKSGGGPTAKAVASSRDGKLPLSVIIFSMLLMNALIFLPLYLLGHGWYYLFFWVLPAVTALQVLLRIRGIAEHAGYTQNPDQRQNARTVVNPIQTFIFAPHNVNYHVEHHIYPAVPFYNLPKLHKLFMAKALIPEKNLFYGYRQVLAELIHS